MSARGGRKKATPNKKTATVAEKLAALGYGPIEGMAGLAMDETVEASIRAQMHQELAQYIYPKCKAIEVSGDEGGPAQTYGVLVAPGMIEQDEWEHTALKQQRKLTEREAARRLKREAAFCAPQWRQHLTQSPTSVHYR